MGRSKKHVPKKKQQLSDDWKYDIVEIIGHQSKVVRLESDWCKSVLWDIFSEEDVSPLDTAHQSILQKYRSLNLTEDEANLLVDVLLRKGYGTK